MDQDTLNKNLVNAISKLNKAIMSLQEKVIVIASQDPHINHIADLTRMDMDILDQLQGSLDRLKNMV